MSIIGTKKISWKNTDHKSNEDYFELIIRKLNENKTKILESGGKVAVEKQHKKGRLTARERVKYLMDQDSKIFEIGTFAGYEMYEEYGSHPAGGVITSIVKISGLDCMVIANDATVKAGAWFPITGKKYSSNILSRFCRCFSTTPKSGFSR